MVALEERILFLERHVEELDGVVRELYDRVQATRDEIARFREETRQQLDDIVRSPEDDVPPHW